MPAALPQLFRFFAAGIAAAALASAAVAQDAQGPAVGIEELYRLDLLPRFKQSASVGMISSYDRTGGNDDGFSGRYSFVRKEGDGLVIADLKGPGAIYRIWTPTPTDDPIEFYFDGEAEPRLRLKFRELFLGNRDPFLSPVVGYGAGGFWSYVPLPYRTSCKVVIRAPRVQFYQINYATYPEGHAVRTFDPAAPEFRRGLEQARKLVAATGTDITAFSSPQGDAPRTDRIKQTLQAGKTVKLWEAKRGGRILGLRLGPADALAGKARDILLRIYWDGDKEPAVLSPAGDFFGASWGDPAVRSLMAGTSNGTSYVYFPMPFDRSARIELVSERRDGPAIEVTGEVVHSSTPRRPDEGRFYALWRRENPTTKGKPFTFIDTQGRGHVVGVALQAQGSESGHTFFFEGDDQTTIDGQLVAHGTGSEDFFNGGWYDVPGRWESRVTLPFSGCLDYKKALARTGAYRWFLTDAQPFRKSILQTIEHAPTENNLVTDYAGVTYLYAEARPTMQWTVPPVAQRAVQDLDKLVYVPGWNVPLHSFSIERATLTKKNEKIGNQDVRYLSMRTQGDDIFGLHSLGFLCEIPAAGKYRISVEGLRGPDQGILQLFKDEGAVGEAVDMYAAERGKSGIRPVGTLELREGLNQVFFKLVGKNPQSSGMGLDLITLHFERVP